MVDQQITALFNAIYDDTYVHAARYVTARCGDTSDIADILQEIYLEVYRVLIRKGTRHIRNGQAFVMRIAKTKVYRHYKSAERRTKPFSFFAPRGEDGEDGGELELPDFERDLQTRDMEDGIAESLVAEEVWAALSRKSQDVRRIFYLYYYCELKLSEIAAELGLSESNVKHKLYRTLQELREHYRRKEELT